MCLIVPLAEAENFDNQSGVVAESGAARKLLQGLANVSWSQMIIEHIQRMSKEKNDLQGKDLWRWFYW
jgi:hypothetical protein